MKKETVEKLCASYMEDVRGVKRKSPNREFVLRKVEDAYKGIKPLSWTVGKYGMWANTFIGMFSIRPLLKGGFAVIYNSETVCTRPTLSKAKKFANNIYKKNAKEKLGL